MLNATACAEGIARLGETLVHVAETIGATVYAVDDGPDYELARLLGAPVLYVRSRRGLAFAIAALTVEQWSLEVDVAALAEALLARVNPATACYVEQPKGVQPLR